MRSSLIAAVGIVVLSVPSFALSHVRRGPTSHRIFSKHQSKAATKSASQRTIDPERASQIQSALIHSGYLSGEASGHWDANTEAAMQRYQAANGWQTKLTPDSRAIIKLGLGSSAGSETQSDAGVASADAFSSPLSSR
jgi:peptidoglycan hydrolase-like protein with peptidoglycan-binding domain